MDIQFPKPNLLKMLSFFLLMLWTTLSNVDWRIGRENPDLNLEIMHQRFACTKNQTRPEQWMWNSEKT